MTPFTDPYLPLELGDNPLHLPQFVLFLRVFHSEQLLVELGEQRLLLVELLLQ